MDATTGQERIAIVGDILLVSKMTGSGPAPTIAAGSGAGTGTGLAVTIAGTDLAGNITVTTGATALSPAASATVVTITFGTSGSATPQYVQLSPANSAAASLSASGSVFAPIPGSGGSFTISSGVTALIISTTYKWYYHVIW